MLKQLMRIAMGTVLTVSLLTTGCSQRTSEPQYFAGDQDQADQQTMSPKDETGIDSHVNDLED